MASLTMAMIILFVVSNFFVHINRKLNAGFLVQKNFSHVKQESNLSCVTNAQVAMTLTKCSA